MDINLVVVQADCQTAKFPGYMVLYSDGLCSLDILGNVVNFGAVFVSHYSPLSGSSVSTQHYAILQSKFRRMTILLHTPGNLNTQTTDVLV